MRRTALTLASALLAATPLTGLGTASAALAAPARVTVTAVHLNGFETALVADVNRVRRNAGLRPLVVIAGATDVARRWSWRLASAQILSHNPSILSDISRAGSAAWTEIAENVGEGPSDSPDVLFNAYMASPPHRANILDPAARFIGVGVVERDGVAWNTLDFTNAYNNGYGITEVPAAGLTMDAQHITRTTDVARLNGVDQRFAADQQGGLQASRLSFATGTSRNGSAFTWLHQDGQRHGLGGVMMRDALDLSAASRICVQVSARGRNNARVPVHLLLRRSFGNTVDLGTVKVGARPQWVSLALPATARTFRNEVVLRVSAAGVRGAGGRVRLAVYDVRAAVDPAAPVAPVGAGSPGSA